MSDNCLSCALKEKADAVWDTNGGDFWWCLAEPIIPAFCGVFYGSIKGRTGQPINLKLFDPEYHPAAHARLKKDCPLFEPINPPEGR